MITTPIGIAVVGFGYWGPNLVRNIAERPEFRLMGLCERDPARGSDFARRYPECSVEDDFDAVLLDPRVQAISIATPPSTHFDLARRALEAGKHVMVEKPLATTAADAEQLIALAARVERVLMPGHTFVYSPPVNKVRELIRSGELGDVYFVTSSRMNLGLYQPDGVISDLAPHDLSILLYWLDRPVTHIAAAGQSIFRDGVPETAFLTVTFSGGTTANVQISWLAPRKMRQMVVVGSKRMVSYEDNSADESVRIYDRGLDVAMTEAPATFGEYKLTYRSGDIVVPRIEAGEPLSLELADFANAIRTGEEPRSSSALGLEVVRSLEARRSARSTARDSCRRRRIPTGRRGAIVCPSHGSQAIVERRGSPRGSLPEARSATGAEVCAGPRRWWNMTCEGTETRRGA
jgi:predicted dehydrogenase